MSASDTRPFTGGAPPPQALWRRIGTWFLLVLFCIGIAASLVAIWARVQVLDTDAYVETVTPLAADVAVQDAMADRVTNLLEDQIERDEATRISLSGVAGGAAMATLLELVHRTVLDLVQSPNFQTYWVEANELAHRTTIEALTSEAEGTVFLENGQVFLDVMPLVTRVEDRLREAGMEDVADRFQIDPAQATFVVIESDALRKMEGGVALIDTLAIAVPIATLMALAGCLAMASRRWRTLFHAGVGTAVTLVLALVILAAVRELYLVGLEFEQNPDALAAVFDIVFRGLRDAFRLVAAGALAVAGIAWMASLPLLQAPRLVGFVSRYRRELDVGILAAACLVLITVDDVSLLLAAGVGLFGVSAMAVVFWLSIMPPGVTVTAPQGDAIK